MSSDDHLSFELSDGEKMHPLWARLKAQFQNQLQVLRVKNDSSKLTEHETAEIRGHIKCLKAIIAVGDDRPLTG